VKPDGWHVATDEEWTTLVTSVLVRVCGENELVRVSRDDTH